MCAIVCVAMDKIYRELKIEDITTSYEAPEENAMELA